MTRTSGGRLQPNKHDSKALRERKEIEDMIYAFNFIHMYVGITRPSVERLYLRSRKNINE